MKPIILFVPYYGDVPPYMHAFLHTVASQNDFLDVCIISDNVFLNKIRSFDLPANVKLVEKTWEVLCNDISEKKKLIRPFFPYKLCDYKPAYGYIFEEYTKGYEYWGYCDVDVMMGDVKTFLERHDFRKYDRIGNYGHFTIYRNTEELRMFFNSKYDGQHHFDIFDNICKTTYPCHFDESGTNKMFNLLYGSERFLSNNFVLNTSYDCKGCHTYEYQDIPQILTWEKGKVFSYTIQSGQIVKEEAMYIHFMKEKTTKAAFCNEEKLILTSDRIMPFEEKDILMLLEEYGKVDSYDERKNVKFLLQKKMKRDRLARFCREASTVGLWNACFVFFSRMSAIPMLVKYKHL